MSDGGQSPISMEPPEGRLVDESGVTGRDPRSGRFRFKGGLRQRAARGTIVNSAFLIGMSGVAMIRGLVLAGLIATTEYGVWGVLVVGVGTLMSLKQVGISDKFIQQDEADQQAAFQKAFTLDLLLTLGFIAIVGALLPVMQSVYGVDDLVAPGLVLLATFLIATLQAPLWVFYRRMEFGRQRALQAIEPILGLGVAITLAVMGAGYWSFVIAFIAGHAAMAAACVAFSPYPIRLRFDGVTARSYLSFSWPIFVATAGALVISQAAVLTTRWEIGLAATGVIALAANISAFVDRVDQLITGTLYPAICAVKDQPALLLESFVKSNRLALMWAVPAGIGLTLFAPDLVEFGIGDKWQPAVVVLQVYGIVAALNQIGFNWTAYYRARGDTRPIAVAAGVSMVTFLAAVVPLVSSFGLPGFAASIALQAVSGLAARAFYLHRLFGEFRFIAHAGRGFVPALVPTAAILASRVLADVDRTIAFAASELAVYLLLTAAATWLFESTLLREAAGYFARQTPIESAPPDEDSEPGSTQDGTVPAKR